MRRNQVAVVGAAETTELGVIPNMSQLQLHADAALNAIADAGLKLSDIDGFATAVETPQQVCHYLGIKPTWVDGTSVGGCSFMLHVRHAAAAIEAGLCKIVLITHAESGKSMIGKQPRFTPPYSIAVVELDEGPRMMTNIVDCPQTPEALALDMKLEVKFEPLDEAISLPLFRPAKG